MNKDLPNRVMLMLKEAANIARCTTDELLEKLIHRDVPVHVRVPRELQTFAHLEKAQQPWRRHITKAPLHIRLDTLDYGALSRPPVARNQLIVGDRFARLDTTELNSILLTGSARSSRFGEMIILSSGSIRNVSPRDFFLAAWTLALIGQDCFFVAVSQCEVNSADELIETDFESTQAELWIEKKTLKTLPDAQLHWKFGKVVLGRWASRLLIELNEASYRLFSEEAGDDGKLPKEKIEQWVKLKWNKVPTTMRGHVPSLITPDCSLREIKSIMRKISAPIFSLSKNEYTSTRLALMNETAKAAFEQGRGHDRSKILELLEERGIAGAIGSSAASIIVMPNEKRRPYA